MEIKLDDKELFTECKRFDFSKPPFDPSEFAHGIAKCTMENSVYSLSANQVGYPYRIICIVAQPIMVMFNPIVVDVAKNEIVLEEVCASYPHFKLKVKRPEAIRLRFAYPNGQIQTLKYQGITARLILHEMDHLDGKNFRKAGNLFNIEKAKKEEAKLKKESNKDES